MLDERTTTDLLVAEFAKVLLLGPDEQLDPDDNYFDLGMSSLRLMDVRARVEEVLGVRVEAAVFYEALTITRLAEVITGGSPTPEAAVDTHEQRLAHSLVARLYDAPY